MTTSSSARSSGAHTLNPWEEAAKTGWLQPSNPPRFGSSEMTSPVTQSGPGRMRCLWVETRSGHAEGQDWMPRRCLSSQSTKECSTKKSGWPEGVCLPKPLRTQAQGEPFNLLQVERRDDAYHNFKLRVVTVNSSADESTWPCPLLLRQVEELKGYVSRELHSIFVLKARLFARQLMSSRQNSGRKQRNPTRQIHQTCH